MSWGYFGEDWSGKEEELLEGTGVSEEEEENQSLESRILQRLIRSRYGGSIFYIGCIELILLLALLQVTDVHKNRCDLGYILALVVYVSGHDEKQGES